LLPVLSPIFVLRLSHSGVVFSAGADMKTSMQTGRVADAEPELEPDTGPDAEPDAEPDVEPGVEPDAEPDATVSMTDVTAVSVGRLKTSPIEE
jgi:hypothetical protein